MTFQMLLAVLLGAAVLFVIGVVALVISLRKRAHVARMERKLLGRGKASPAPPPTQAAFKDADEDGDVVEGGPTHRLPLIGSLVREADFLGLGRLAFPVVMAMLATTYFVADMLPFDYLPGASWVIGFMLVYFISGMGLRYFGNKKRTLVEQELPIFLDGIARGLRIGKGFEDCLVEAASMLSPKMQDAVNEIRVGIAVGMPASRVFAEQADKMRIDDLLFVSAVLAANEKSGGAMAPAIEGLSQVVRANRDLKMEVQSLASQGKLSGDIMAAAPIGFLVLFSFAQPAMVEGFFGDPWGNLALLIVLTLCLLCFAWVRRLAAMKV